MTLRSSLLAGLTLPLTLMTGCREGGPAGTRGATADEPRSVAVARVELREAERTITAFGSFLAQEQATLSVKVAGRLQETAVDLGSSVKAGTVLARIEPREFDMRVRQAEAALAQALAGLGLDAKDEDRDVDPDQTSVARQARAVFDEARASRDRVASLHKQGVLSQAELDTAEAAFTVAENRYQDAVEEVRRRIAMVAQRRIERDIAAQQLKDTTLLAPFDASVQERVASPGEYLSAGDPVVTLIQMSPLRLRLEISERDAPRIRPQQTVRARVEGIDRTFTGRIARISPAIDPLRRVLLVEADIVNEGSLHPGMFARGEIVVNASEPALAVPTAALVTFAGIEKVYQIEEGKVRERVVATGRRGDNWIEVVTNLGAGEEVILSPGSLQNGQPVAISPAPLAGAPAGVPRTNAPVSPPSS